LVIPLVSPRVYRTGPAVVRQQQATAVAFDDTEEDGGSYYVAGWTWREYFAENVGSDNDGDIGYDAWVVRINNLEDQEEDLVGSVQFGSAAYDVPTALVTSGVNVYVVGNIRDDGDVLSEFSFSSCVFRLVFLSCFVLCFLGADEREVLRVRKTMERALAYTTRAVRISATRSKLAQRPKHRDPSRLFVSLVSVGPQLPHRQRRRRPSSSRPWTDPTWEALFSGNWTKTRWVPW